MKNAAPVKRELPSLECHKCRRWVVTQEKHNGFASVDGVPQKVSVWTCPACRGEAGAVVVEARAPVTQGDINRDEKYGPMRHVLEVVERAGGHVARLECGHERSVHNLKTPHQRCRKCRPKASGARW